MRTLGWLSAIFVGLLPAPALASSALSSVVPMVARDLGPLPRPGALAGARPNVLVVSSVLVTDVPAPRGEELSVRIASLLAGRLGPTARAYPQAAALSIARAAAAKVGVLVYAEVEVARGSLRVTLDAYPAVYNAWDRVREPAPPARAHAFGSAPIDAEVRSFLTPISLEQARVHKASHDMGDVIAASCGDVDGDGGMDLVLVSRAAVAWGHIEKGAFAPAYAAPWPSLAVRVPVPMREPLATAAIEPFAAGGGLFVGTTDRGGVALSPDLRASSALAGLPLFFAEGLLCLTPSPGAGGFEAPAFACGGAYHGADLDTGIPRYDAVAIARIVARDGKSRDVVAARAPDGKVSVRSGDASVTVEGSGGEIAVGDLDLDGVPEVITTLDGADDALSVSSWGDEGLRTRLHLPAPAGVRAIAVCPPEEGGLPALVAVVGAEVWVVR